MVLSPLSLGPAQNPPRARSWTRCGQPATVALCLGLIGVGLLRGTYLVDTGRAALQVGAAGWVLIVTSGLVWYHRHSLELFWRLLFSVDEAAPSEPDQLRAELATLRAERSSA